jgi:drug/metabolite transporter (DMT)-like permease
MTLLPLLLIGVSAFLHAGWNLLAHSHRSDNTLFLRVTLITGLIGVVPALLTELQGPPVAGQVWGWLVLTGACQALYYLGLSSGYRSGDFSMVYPLARALPVLALALVDALRGHAPSPLGLAGMLLVSLGCILVPLESLRNIRIGDYLHRTMLWVLVTALGTVGYTAIDKIASEALPAGPIAAARYGVWEVICTIPFLWFMLCLPGQRTPGMVRHNGWRWALIAAFFIFAAYWLVLWAYQLSPLASYVSGLRQLSIVIGVVVAVTVLRERAPVVRTAGALIITAGIICISLA